VAVADFNRYHIVLFRAESQVSICRALANALSVMASLARMAALLLLLAGLVYLTVLAEEFI
jgi:hypothetical protein